MQTSFLQAKIDDLVADHEKLVKDNQELEKQLSSAQKLIALYKNNSEQRTTESLELQEVIRDLRTHIEASHLLFSRSSFAQQELN